MRAGQVMEMNVSYEVKDLGGAALVVAVRYEVEKGEGEREERGFRKVYRFQVWQILLLFGCLSFD
jgi:hypothetical protein